MHYVQILTALHDARALNNSISSLHVMQLALELIFNNENIESNLPPINIIIKLKISI